MSIINDQGQGTLESLLVLPLVFMFFAGLSLLSYRALIFYYADFQLHEAIVCTQAHPTRTCQSFLDQQLRRALIFGKLEKSSLKATARRVEGQLRIEFSGRFQKALPQLSLRKTLHLPLEQKK